MTIQLPVPVAAFFQASNNAQLPALRQCFAEDSIVHDERQTYQGLDAITAWQTEAQRKYGYSAEPLTCTQDGGTIKVIARYTGNFPGSPVELTNLFRLDNDRIVFLEIC